MLLGLSGKALSGKDTVADYILSSYGWHRKVGFASNLKEACMNIFGLSEYLVFTQEGKISSLPKEILVNKSILENYLTENGIQLAVFLVYSAKEELDHQQLNKKTIKLFNEITQTLHAKK